MNNRARFLLFPFTLIYWLVIRARNFLYDHGFLNATKLDCRVISVGNLSTGGTGKTPATVYIASILLEAGVSVGILSRGYGRTTSGTLVVSEGNGPVVDCGDAGDEPVMMARQLPHVPVVVDENRVRGGQFLSSKFGVASIILDDGFQHRGIYRDIDFVLISDKSFGAGFFQLLPTGNYREPLSSISRAGAVIFSKVNITPPQDRQIALIERAGIPIFRFELQYAGPDVVNSTFPCLSALEIDSRVVLVAGIGNPGAFSTLVRKAGVHVAGERFFRDHYTYKKEDLSELETLLEASEADMILTTEKDYVRLEGLDPGFPVRVFPVRARAGNEKALLEILSG